MSGPKRLKRRRKRLRHRTNRRLMKGDDLSTISPECITIIKEIQFNQLFQIRHTN